jgi:serine/threonine protein kinase
LDLDPGTVVANRYRISRPLGRGGMGEVFAAENIRTGRPVAIKLLRQDTKGKSSAVARFRQEARAAGSINSDHVTQVLDVEEDPEHGVVLVFELLEGESLIDRLKRTGPIPFDELWPIIEQVWLGLADAHRAGIIHRDLKPSNVFLERRPDGTIRVKILDFGISKVPKEVGGETLTEMGQSLGTFSFMPPEQIGKAKTVDHRADVYACATLIYQSLTGQLPYAARNILVMVEMKTKTDARKLGEAMQGAIDPRLEAFVARGLSRDAAQRFPTALDALDVWRELRPQGPPSTPQSSSGGQSGHSSGSGQSSSRPRSQPPVRGSGVASSIPRMPAAPAIFESSGPLPQVNNDLVEMTTEETAATIAMPMPHLKKGHSAQATPPLAPRVDSATASISNTGSGTQPANQLQQRGAPKGGVGPGGTQQVMIGRALDHLSERKPRSAEPGDGSRPRTDDPRGGNLAAHPAGYYLPPAVQASLSRPQAQPGYEANAAAARANAAAQAAAQAAPLTPAPSGLPRTYEEPSSGSEPSGGAPEGEGRTQVYRPRVDETARHPQEARATPTRAKRSLPLILVLLSFLLVGFVAVACLMWFVRR